MTWTDLGDNHHVLTMDGARVAVTFFIGGHVERPDAWYVRLRGEHDARSAISLSDAKSIAEDHFGCRS